MTKDRGVTTRSRAFTAALGVCLLLGAVAVLGLLRCRGAPFSIDRAPTQAARGRAAQAARTSAETPIVSKPRLPGSVEVAMTVRCDEATHVINPLIYGIGVLPMHHAAHQWLLGATARRWGGNHTSRYNWEHGNAWNTGKDWFFRNVDYDGAAGPAYQRFIDANLSHGVATALTVPIIGWAAKDTTSYGFPVSAQGRQQAVAPEDSDMGNGLGPGGGLLTPGPPERTSVPVPPASIGRWVRTLREKDKARGKRGVQMYILDNEPTLWHSTHRDVHPSPLSYDELLERTIAYATEIRHADPDAVIAGPALWGWHAYFHSGVDQAANGRPDRDKHGGMPLLAWWLREVALHEKHVGTRLIDVVDVHFYPQGRGLGVGLEGGRDPDSAARRIRSTRSLWDPSYKDESWIAEKMRVLPLMHEWIGQYYRGRGISIGEWNFGAEEHMSGGLAVAEALGRFGEQGLYSAFYWDFPALNSPAFWAFRAFRNFDGRGGRFLERSTRAQSSNPIGSIFASRDATGKHMVLVVLALDPQKALTLRLDTSSCGRIQDERGFVYTGGDSGFVPVQTNLSAVAAGQVVLPAYSIAVLDLKLAP